MYIVIWQTPTKLYYKIVKGTYRKYYVGMENRYSHKVILVVDLFKDIGMFYKKRNSFKDIVINILKTCIKKLERR